MRVQRGRSMGMQGACWRLVAPKRMPGASVTLWWKAGLEGAPPGRPRWTGRRWPRREKGAGREGLGLLDAHTR